MENIPAVLGEDVMSSLVLNGDISKLNPAQKMSYYNSLCARIGLDPVTQPFQLIKLQGKEVMYATKGATQQLAKTYNISFEQKGREIISDVLVVTVKATMKDGRYTDEEGAVSIAGLKGEPLANAMMKASTKAKRRAVLSLLGLGMLDESELDTLPQAVKVEIHQPPQRKSATDHPTIEELEMKRQKKAAEYAKTNPVGNMAPPPATNAPAKPQAPATGVKTATGFVAKQNEPNKGGYVTFEIENYLQEDGRFQMRFATNDTGIVKTIAKKHAAGEKVCLEYKSVPWKKGDKSGMNYEITDVIQIQEQKEELPF